MAAPMQNRSHGHNLASSTIPSRVILNFPLLYFTEVLLLGAIKGLKQKALTVGAVQGVCFLEIGTEQLTFSAETGSRQSTAACADTTANPSIPRACHVPSVAFSRGYRHR